MLSSGNILPTQEAILPALIKENKQLPFAVDDDGNQTKELKYRLAACTLGRAWLGLQKPGKLMSSLERLCLGWHQKPVISTAAKILQGINVITGHQIF